MVNVLVAMHARVELMHACGIWHCKWGNLNSHAYTVRTAWQPLTYLGNGLQHGYQPEARRNNGHDRLFSSELDKVHLLFLEKMVKCIQLNLL